MDMNQYLDIFIDETREHLESLNEQILILEKEPENEATINEIFRAAHSLKGMAGTMGFKRMQNLTHDMESVFQEVRNGNMKVNDSFVDVLFKGVDALESYLANIQADANEGTEDNEDILKALKGILESNQNTNTAVDKPESKATDGASVQESQENEETNHVMIELVDHEKNAVISAFDKGLNVFGLEIAITEACVLKSARAFLVFRNLEEIGTIIKSVPAVQDIEDEKFEQIFQVVLITTLDKEVVENRVKTVSEIETVSIYDIEKPEKPVVEEKIVQRKEVKKQNDNTTEQKKQQGKPVVNRSVRVDIEKLDILMNLVSELIIAKNGLVSFSQEVNKQEGNNFNEQIEYLERVTTNLHEAVMKVRMVPIENVVSRFPRMIRDLSKKLDKPIELVMTGEETELDRTVIDEIGDPLMHLLRNAADHGLESSKVRSERNKPETGTICLEAYQEGNNVVIKVRDDGAGINIEKVKQKALNREIITLEQAETMTDKDYIDLLFQPSFSTAEVISDVSGRGVGLDVVKTKIESLGGDIEAKSVLGEGSEFTIQLPLTLAIIQALMVEIGTEKYAIPLGNIQTIEDVDRKDIKSIHGQEVITLRDTVLPIISLKDVLDVQTSEEELVNLTVVVVAKGDKMAGLVVDNLIGQQEIVIKSMGKYIDNNRLIGGATILGDGEVALILDVNSLM